MYKKTSISSPMQFFQSTTNPNELFSYFLQNYTPTSFDKKITDLIVDNQRVSFVIWDTAG